uniref:Uncharacterized protein n=1 Tax=viral metagenome TaxID=1070528 RepID=A0A6M3K537_9ZZZZ
MPGQYLRTNYRATGKELDIDTLGRAIGLASAAAGAGTIRPGGGLLFFSASGSFANDAVGLAAGASNVFANSTYGTLSLFYGSGNFGSGHLFYPIYIRTLSYSTVANTDWVTNNSAPDFLPVNFATSDSVWMISAMKVSATGSATVASQVAARLLVLGFVVSTP